MSTIRRSARKQPTAPLAIPITIKLSSKSVEIQKTIIINGGGGERYLRTRPKIGNFGKIYHEL